MEPGRILAGEHPDGGGEAATRARIDALLGAGVRGFLDLTEEGEMTDYGSLLPAGVQRQAFALPDHSVPHTAQQMRDVQDSLQRLLAAGTTIYVHCRAGVGRTGTVAGCWLVERGLTAKDALALLQHKFQAAGQSRSGQLTPETDAQRAFIATLLAGPAALRSA